MAGSRILLLCQQCCVGDELFTVCVAGHKRAERSREVATYLLCLSPSVMPHLTQAHTPVLVLLAFSVLNFLRKHRIFPKGAARY